jgi:hypothetical protein
MMRMAGALVLSALIGASHGKTSWAVAVLVDTIQRASCAMCNVRGSTFMNSRARAT